MIALVAFVATAPLAVDDAEAADVSVATHTPVVLVVFDEFPVSSLMRADGSLDAVRYPNFARLARDATWYPRATTVHDSTTIAVPAILTGQRPKPGTLPTLADHPDNLFTLLGKRYTIRASEQVTRLCPSRYCPRTREVPVLDRQRGLFYDVSVGYLHRVLPASLRGGLPPIGERWGGFGESSHVDTRELVLGALDTNAWMHAVLRAKGSDARAVRPIPRLPPPTRRRTARPLRRARVAAARSLAFPAVRSGVPPGRQPETLSGTNSTAGSSRRCSSTRRSSTTCCRSDTSTRSSGRSCAG